MKLRKTKKIKFILMMFNYFEGRKKDFIVIVIKLKKITKNKPQLKIKKIFLKI
jgi:hypothetical protein